MRGRSRRRRVRPPAPHIAILAVAITALIVSMAFVATAPEDTYPGWVFHAEEVALVLLAVIGTRWSLLVVSAAAVLIAAGNAALVVWQAVHH